MQEQSTAAEVGLPLDQIVWGDFYAIQLAPEALSSRLKLGWSAVVEQRLRQHRNAAPTARLLRSWRCPRHLEPASIRFLTGEACTAVGGEVFDCHDLSGFLARADALFAGMALMAAPSPAASERVPGYVAGNGGRHRRHLQGSISLVNGTFWRGAMMVGYRVNAAGRRVRDIRYVYGPDRACVVGKLADLREVVLAWREGRPLPKSRG